MEFLPHWNPLPRRDRTYLEIRNEVLPELLRRLVDAYDPEAIVLFGPPASSDWRPGDTLQVLVVPSHGEVDRMNRQENGHWGGAAYGPLAAVERDLGEPVWFQVDDEYPGFDPVDWEGRPVDHWDWYGGRVVYLAPRLGRAPVPIPLGLSDSPPEPRQVIQIDIDGTLDAAPEFFRWMTGSLRRYGHRVLIVSSRVESSECRVATLAELKGWGIDFDELLLTPEDIKPEALLEGLHPGHRMYAYKVMAAREHGTSILFDDCGITAELFKRYLPEVNVFRPQAPA